ncbi:MAG: hypothetical protein KJ622_11070 [Alphaproteobacteria bacterium]|nr:hypothetical protein [Alphaproteobacteria bacterium]
MILVFAIAFNQLAAGLAHAGMLEGHNHLQHDHASAEQPHDHSVAPVKGGHEHNQAVLPNVGNTAGNGIPAGLPNNSQHDKNPCCAVGFSPCGVILPVPLGIPKPAGLILANGSWEPDSPKSWRIAPLLRPPIFIF